MNTLDSLDSLSSLCPLYSLNTLNTLCSLDALKTLETLKQQLMEIADIKGQISAIPLMPAGGALMAGGFGAGGSTINSSITMNMNGATPMAAMAAAKATVASMALQRA